MSLARDRYTDVGGNAITLRFACAKRLPRDLHGIACQARMVAEAVTELHAS